MIAQLFKIIWKQRRHNGLMIVEIIFSFIALFAMSVVMIHYIKRYHEPLGMNYNNIWIINAWQPWDAPAENKLSDSILIIRLNLLKRDLKNNYPEIKEITKITSQDVPYIQNWSQNCTDYMKKEICYQQSQTEPDFAKTFDMKLLEGRWIGPEDAASTIKTVTINRKLKVVLFGNQSAAGKTIYIGGDKPIQIKIAGVFEAIKRQGEFTEEPNFMFEGNIDKYTNYSGFAIKLNGSIDKNFEAKLMKNLESLNKTFKYRIEKLENIRKQYILSELAPLIIIGAIVTFLIVNVMLGLFGMLWLSTSRRKSEIGLRMAVGSSSAKVLWQLLGETYVLAMVAITIGLVFTSQMFIFNIYNVPVVTLLEANLAAMFLILLFCTISAFAPAKLAALLQPAEALHEE